MPKCKLQSCDKNVELQQGKRYYLLYCSDECRIAARKEKVDNNFSSQTKMKQKLKSVINETHPFSKKIFNTFNNTKQYDSEIIKICDEVNSKDLPYKYIPLHNNKYAVVDKEDFEFLSRFKWLISSNGKKHISVYRAIASAKTNNKNVVITKLMSVDVLERHNVKIVPGSYVVHLNKNNLINTFDNLEMKIKKTHLDNTTKL